MSNCNDIIEQKYKDALEKEYRAIGLTDQVIEGDWNWISGEEVSWTPASWGYGEPNGNGDHAWVKAGFQTPNMTLEEVFTYYENQSWCGS